MKVSLPFARTRCLHRVYTVGLEREPSWLIGVEMLNRLSVGISLFRTVYAGIYGFF